jgi:hypothetical protein
VVNEHGEGGDQRCGIARQSWQRLPRPLAAAPASPAARCSDFAAIPADTAATPAPPGAAAGVAGDERGEYADGAVTLLGKAVSDCSARHRRQRPAPPSAAAGVAVSERAAISGLSESGDSGDQR